MPQILFFCLSRVGFFNADVAAPSTSLSIHHQFNSRFAYLHFCSNFSLWFNSNIFSDHRPSYHWLSEWLQVCFSSSSSPSLKSLTSIFVIFIFQPPPCHLASSTLSNHYPHRVIFAASAVTYILKSWNISRDIHPLNIFMAWNTYLPNDYTISASKFVRLSQLYQICD